MALNVSILKGLISTDLTTAGYVLTPDSYMDKFLDAVCNNIVLHITTSSVITGADPQGGVVTSTIT